MNASENIILASSSPRRRLLLQKLGIPFEVAVPDVDERALPFKSPREFAIKAAYTKARAVECRFPVGTILLAADTIVVVDTEIFGKPKDRGEARSMLGRLAGRPHKVITGVAVTEAGKSTLLDAVAATVYMKNLSSEEIAAYVETNEPLDKAGAYAVQGLGRKLVARIEGDYFTVVGLPATKLMEMLAMFTDVSLYRTALRELTPEAFECDPSVSP